MKDSREPTSDWFPETELDSRMHIRETDTPPIKLNREVPAWGIITLLIGMGIWAISQWVSYNGLLATSQTQTKTIGELAVKIAEISDKLNDTKMKNLEQDFMLSRIKERLDSIESVARLPVSRSGK